MSSLKGKSVRKQAAKEHKANAHEASSVEEVQHNVVTLALCARCRDPAAGSPVHLDASDPVSRASERRPASHELIRPCAVEDNARLSDVEPAQDELRRLGQVLGERSAADLLNDARPPAQQDMRDEQARW